VNRENVLCDDDVWEAFQPSTGRVVVRVVTRVDDEAWAQTAARSLVEGRFAACAHVRAVSSVYRFEGDVRSHDEWELDAVTTPERAVTLEATIEAAHPYRLPAIERHDTTVGLAYAQWVREQVTQRG
jgi:periplasmic divalent cation tolerance protein